MAIKKLKTKNKRLKRYKSRYQTGGLAGVPTNLSDTTMSPIQRGQQSGLLSSTQNIIQQQKAKLNAKLNAKMNAANLNQQQHLLRTNKMREKQYSAAPRPRTYQVGGMYADNTVSAAGQGRPGTTSNIVYQESDPKLQAQRIAALQAEQAELQKLGAATEQEVKQMEEGDKAAIARASELAGAKVDAGVNIAQQAVKMGADAGIIGKTGEETTEGVKEVAGLGATAAGKPLIWDMAKGRAVGTQLGGQGTSLAGAVKGAAAAYKAQRLTNQAIKAGTLLQSSAGTAGGAGLSALGQGLGSFAKSGAGIGTIAALAGAGVSKWSDDDDATTMNFGEGAGATLSGIGTGIGAAATTAMIAGSSLGPLGTAAGAIGGAIYGLGKGLIQRNKARKEEKKRIAKRTKKIGEFNTKLRERFGSQMSRVRAGEVKQKTYSGYDLGRNLVAQMGGIRMGMPRYGYAA